MSYKYSKAALLTGTIMAGAMIASPALAQVDEQDEPALQAEPQEAIAPIVVTGSRIARRNVETAAPVAVVQDEEFKLSGTVNVENVINTLPQVVPGTTSFSNNPGNGTATLNLRGLGATRTLVLVNGRRWMFYDTAQIVDLNTIPSFLLDSVDVVTGGASAVYGSDALAGVVNFRLKDVDGAELGGQYSITDRGDGARYEVHGAIGTSFADGRGNATVYGEYYNREEIFQGDREFSTFAIGAETFGVPLQQFGSSLLEETRLTYQGDGTTDSDILNDNGLGFFQTPGDLVPYDGRTYNYAPANYLQLPQERYLIGGYADYDIGGGHTPYAEVSYVNNRVAQELAPTPILVNLGLDIDFVSEFLSDATIDALNDLDASESGDDANDGIVPFQVRRRLTEAGSRNSLDERSAFRILGGMTGPINDYLQYDAYYSFARTRNSNIQQGNASLSRFTAGLDGTGDAPINIFGAGTLTPAQVNSFRIQAQNSDISTLQVITGAVSGTLGDFSIGEYSDPIGFAAGVERRMVSARFIPDEFLASGDVAGFNAGEPTEGGYSVNEVFGELNIPVEFGSARLEVTGAARYSDYSLDTVGGAFTWAAGVEFSPIPDVILRGQYQRAIRAPNVGELFAGSAIGFPGATDPCGTAAATSGALRSQCLANGVPEANLGNAAIIQPDSQTAAFFGGNPNLAEETSDSYTFGVVLQPSFVPGLTLTADYFNIEIEDAITTISLQTALDLCFDGTQTDLSSVNCAGFVGTRDATGAFDRNNAPRLGGANIANIAVSGVDLEVVYSTMLPFSFLTDTGEQDLNLSFLGTWTESSTFAPDQNDPDNVFECAGFFAGNCGEPTPEFKWTARASFVDGPLTTSLRWRHLDSVDDQGTGADPDFATYNGIDTIDTYDLLDLTFSFEASERTTVTFGVNNIFDTLPGTPLFDENGIVTNRPNSLLLGDNQEQANTYPSTYDVLGRDFFASVNFKF
ncbi:TonB-dependent receptor domain-containing protein [Erythrobacter sp. SD-21]|uniref:TonB-dependent receptor domain-containing protein n=1 Tax=Erythrobacter sp. SD-21 TaxID=161528 RepID=UPI000153F0B4|nr:TonB-dependent receptor [Erythrobacter sp. SD-21]EDL48742.1 hypothetical protein ED21_31094 [Erythrobacter sp. SD-21]